MKFNENYNKSSDKIDEGYILTNHISSLLEEAKRMSPGFILGVQALEDILYPHDEDYEKGITKINTEMQKRMEEIQNLKGNQSARITNIEWNKARLKLRLLMEFCDRKGLRKEKRMTIEEGFEDAAES